MPELPEVETIRRDLESLFLNKTISGLDVKDASALTGIGPNGKPRRQVTPAEFETRVIGKTISGFGRKGKYLAMEFHDKTALIFHLRMTGQLLNSPPNYKERLTFSFSDSSKLYYSDRRRFGEVVFSQNWREDPAIQALGVEPMHGALTGEYLKTAFRGRTAPIYSILLNQSLVSGLGNIYVTEALYQAQIRPTKPCGKIALQSLRALASAIQEIISHSIKHRGFSMNTYVDLMGKKGRSQMFSRAYGKEGLPCPRCKAPFKRKVLGGRSVVFCMACQK